VLAPIRLHLRQVHQAVVLAGPARVAPDNLQCHSGGGQRLAGQVDTLPGSIST